MYKITYNWFLPLSTLRRKERISEERFSRNAEISRSTLRHIEAHEPNIRLESIASAANALNLELNVLAVPPECQSELSTVGVGFCILRDGPSSWKIHFFNLVDHFRQTLDPRLLLLPPPSALPLQFQALLASMVWMLCDEAGIDAPGWAKKRYYLEKPWFVAEVEALKASALVESPVYFRRNNIFVLGNFLERL